MSEQYPGGYITKSPPTPNGTTAPGLWTLSQQAAYQQQGLWPAPYTPIYIEETFSTYLYTGNSSTQTITNGIDLSGKGGLVWVKKRNSASSSYHTLVDTQRGKDYWLRTDGTVAQIYDTTVMSSFNTTGFTLDTGSAYGASNTSPNTYVSWTFREQPKFFDIVTYTGNGASSRNIAHALGSTPGCVIVKRTDSTGDWVVWHRSLSTFPKSLLLNSTVAAGTSTTYQNGYILSTSSTTFSVEEGTDTSDVNASGGTYVAYLFAHNAGGFGLSGSDNVISCGSFTGAATINLGYEPQWILVKSSSSGSDWKGDWNIFDSMRGMVVSSQSSAVLSPNLSAAETGWQGDASLYPTSTGFITSTSSGFIQSADTYIYIAIRRGPMKVPTSGTSVFGANARSGTGANATVTGGQIADAALIKNRGSAVGDLFASRLTGTGYLVTSSTAAEVAAGTTILQANPWDIMDGVNVGTTSTITNASSNTFINYLFRRAPSFFDVVCYTGNGAAANNQTHNLGVQPEMCILRRRDGAVNWQVVHKAAGTAKSLGLNVTNASLVDSIMSDNFTSTYFKTSDGTCWFESVNGNTFLYVAYLFATCAGVSKVGSYTGTGTTLQINCGFTGGSRFVLIKRTDSTGDWYVWDSARGIVAGNDPYLLLNSTAAEVTGTDYVDTYSAGFEISSTAPAGINANGGTYIFLAVA